MSRYWDNDGDEAFPNQGEFFEANYQRALRGRRGTKVLLALREALMAVPGHRLIEGALCTVGADRRRLEFREDGWALDLRRYFDHRVEQDGEGVCGWGAYLWHQNVKAGMGPAEAFDSLPTVLGTDEFDGLEATTQLVAAAGVAVPMAWRLAYRNDETYKSMTPEERHAAFIAWIDTQLGATADA